MQRLQNDDRNDTQTIIFEDGDMVSEEETDQESKSNSLFDALKSDPNSFINVLRQPAGGNNALEFVDRFDADKYDLGGLMHHIKTNYGGGDYRFMAYSKGKLKANKLVSIAKSVTVAAVDTPLNAVLIQMEKMQNQMMVIAAEKNTVQPSRGEFMQEMMMMQQFFASNQKQSSGFGEVLSVITGLKELGIPIGIQPQQEEGFGGLIDKFAPLATAMVQATQRGLPTQAPIENPSPRPTQRREREINKRNTQPKPQPKPQTEEEKMSLALKIGIARLVQMARHNEPHHEAAELILNNMSDEQAVAVFSDENALEKLKQYDNSVSLYSEWFKAVGEHVKAMLGMPSTVSDQYDDGTDEDLNGDDDDDIVSDDEVNDLEG